MTSQVNWNRSYSIETTADVPAVWRVLSEFKRWHEWNAGVRGIGPEGPFSAGTWFAMTLPDGTVIRSQIIELEDGSAFTDETRIDDTIVRVRHELLKLSGDRCRVTFAVAATGPQAAEFGEGASADFPDVLQSLARMVEREKAS
jgi:Polyketide cyclase / dehydrase and lipid transport